MRMATIVFGLLMVLQLFLGVAYPLILALGFFIEESHRYSSFCRMINWFGYIVAPVYGSFWGAILGYFVVAMFAAIVFYWLSWCPLPRSTTQFVPRSFPQSVAWV
jgi:hypothetical protein